MAEVDKFAPLPKGLYPVMLTPFTEDGSAVDHECLAALSQWYLDSGSAGLFPVAQSSEMYTLSPEERLACARTVKKVAVAAGTGAPVLASGTFPGTTDEQAAFVNEMAKEVDCVVVLVCNLAAKEESNEVWQQRCQKLIDLTPGVPLGLYECPAPYHRLLTPAMLGWIASTGRFLWIKDTSRQNALITEKITVLKGIKDSPFRWYNGNVTTTLHSLKEGGDGYGGVSANFYPWVHAWLCANWEKQPEAATKVQRFLTVAEMVVKSSYPNSAKVYLGTEYPEFDIAPKCRVKDWAPVPEEYEKLHQLKLMMEDVCTEYGITPVAPKKFTRATSGGAGAPSSEEPSAKKAKTGGGGLVVC